MHDLAPNEMARPSRGLSVQETEIPLDAAPVRDHLLGRRVYRHTEFILLVNRGDRALVQVEHGFAQLLEPVTDVRLIASGNEVAFIWAPGVDTANATQMTRAARADGRRARVFIVEGMFQHVNFIFEPAPIPIAVLDVVPPEPPKLIEMARRVIEFDEELPPIDLRGVCVDMERIAELAPAAAFLFPCKCSGLRLRGGVAFLDSAPPERDDWTLVGCERSRQLHTALYGREPAEIRTMCPRAHVGSLPEGRALVKCCLLERGLELDGPDRVVVPWGASLTEVRDALELLSCTPVGSAA